VKSTLEKVSRILKPGTLLQKHEEICRFFANGDSMLYSGEISWQMKVPSADRVLRGAAENLDHAFLQIKSHLEELMKHTPPAAKVALIIQEKLPE
jgi:hypothetical protein